jgi:ATP/maltotriose-dependent transcriptional regulator MalT
VKTQAQAIYRKLGVSARADAVDLARKAGLLDETGPLYLP